MKYLTNIVAQHGGRCNILDPVFYDESGNLKSSTNISIASYRGELIQNVRLTHYFYIPIPRKDTLMYLTTNGWTAESLSTNVIGGNGNINHYTLAGDEGFSINDVTFKGLEDVRLVSWNDKLYGIGFRPDILPGKVIPQLIEYTDDFRVAHTWSLDTGQYMEKNWQPIEDQPFRFIYDPEVPHTITLDPSELSENGINPIDAPGLTGGLRGSTQLIRLDDGHYVSICHTSHRYIGADMVAHWVYNHYFVIYDNDLNHVWTSEPFRFVDDCMEFTCGMCRQDNMLYITFSMYDAMVHRIGLPFDEFRTILSTMRADPDAYEGNPNTEYMRWCMEGPLGGPGRLTCLFHQACTGDVTVPEDIPEFISHLHINDDYKQHMLMYFIIRKGADMSLLKEQD